MKALDADLRERITRAVERGEAMTVISARFEVGYSTVKKYKYRQRDTGSTEPFTSRCGRKRSLSPQQAEELGQLAQAEDHTLEDLREKIGATCCRSAIWNELCRQGLSHKKSRRTLPSNPGGMSLPNAGRGGDVSSDVALAASSRNGSSSSTRRERKPT